MKNRGNEKGRSRYVLEPHQPGPYLFSRDEDGVDDVWLIHADGAPRGFAEMRFRDDDDGSKGRKLGATAKLLAAAPQLLATMKLVEAGMVACDGRLDGMELYWLVRAAVEIAETRIDLCVGTDAGAALRSETDFSMLPLPRGIRWALASIYNYLWTEDKSRYRDMTWPIKNVHLWWTLTLIKAEQVRAIRRRWKK